MVSQNKKFREEGFSALIENEKDVEHRRALEVLKIAKEKDAKKKDLISIRIDKNTIKLMPREKAIKLGLI